ncbi:MAG: ABC transporter ATP-binding protein [Candidatus Nitronauta litoralis]|uniref:ABC transporter ATP-binding protein n=1 Tax=Candidatus Nitronauta litoralis TaxID=2705533 RepID=A0A7T0G116_9BACT|nr:MAG: ABC transporter ATP-binding protein [Candidatus Nitronauta litoralis]
MSHLLSISDLNTCFDTDDGVVQAVRNIDLHLDQGEILALVGESGCGKSVTALSVMGLIPTPPGRFASGRIEFEETDLLKLDEQGLQNIRGNAIGMIFQEPMTSLNPIFTIGDQIMEVILRHRNVTQSEAREQALSMLKKVAISSPETRLNQYPHELSGGMKQRVMIAMAIACNPKLLIADEPTTALDVTVQAQILELLDELRRNTGMAILLITHNLGIVAQYADRVAVMYSGKIVEEGGVETMFENPAHPYTRGLLNSLPKGEVGLPLETIPGMVPHPTRLPNGCAFHPRCSEVHEPCAENPPDWFPAPGGSSEHRTACWLYQASPGNPVTP